ncbi:4'-phosphopantetheinyl transferase superfamily protein [Kitasatospora aureofaciens]|uniref:4'-phosphopantetheinyl transferase family protein n=1 Tax=Kitasatospora aureofaciens TaxID=1894 RepID=UPI001C477059|nr:4'-phosphopantetheinyl transferase superfamily protein [Kitasatospora aureofaciens]MBV6701511.1 4'-phosphopantetheinyl transferase superfamily protein [Kitasatospora aureofaciens]
MISTLLPAAAVAVESTIDREIPLFPAEARHVRDAVVGRQREFTTVRWCARQALGRLGLPVVPILPGHRGAPRWPEQLVGSMTHCAGYRAAVLAPRAEVSAIGIDAEPNAPLPDRVLDSISLPEERAWIERLSWSAAEVSWDRLLFSIKESVYKTWFPLTGRELGFEDALVTVDPVTRTFRANLLLDRAVRATGVPTWFDGRFGTAGGVLLTAIALPARQPDRPADADRRLPSNVG